MKTKYVIETTNQHFNGQSFDHKENAEKIEKIANRILNISTFFESTHEFYLDELVDYTQVSNVVLSELVTNSNFRKLVSNLIQTIDETPKQICGWTKEDFKSELENLEFKSSLNDEQKEELIFDAMEYFEDTFDANQGATWGHVNDALKIAYANL